MARDYRTFAEFWPFYLREHSKPRTRALHYAGTSLVVAILLFAVVTGRWWLLLAGIVIGAGVLGWLLWSRRDWQRERDVTSQRPAGLADREFSPARNPPSMTR